MRHFAIVLLAASSLCAADAVRRLPVANGAMSEGTDTCAAWTGRWTGSGKLVASRDTRTFKKGPASLCLATDGEAKGNIHQMIDVAGSSTVELGGWLKVDGALKVLVFIQAFDAEFKPIDYQVVKNQVEPTGWIEFDGKVALPPKTVRVAVGMQVDGNGKAWLDEVRGEPAR